MWGGVGEGGVNRMASHPLPSWAFCFLFPFLMFIPNIFNEYDTNITDKIMLD